MDNIHLHRKEAVSMEEVVDRFIKGMKLAAGLNTQRVFAAWDACSGAGPFTLRRYFRTADNRAAGYVEELILR